jgi:hypothetical protein
MIMSGWDLKNLAEIVILVTYGIAIVSKVLSVESSLRHRIMSNSNRIDLAIKDESAKIAVLQQNSASLKAEMNERLSIISQAIRDLQNRMNHNHIK